MARKQHSLDEVLRSLGKKHDCQVNPQMRVIRILNPKAKPCNAINDLGNKSWGKIDYLCHYCGYSWYHVTQF